METAWIAFAGVVIGTIISIVGGIITARLTMRAQIKAAALNTFLAARLKAYRDYEIASERLSNERSHEAMAAFYRAVNTAALVASDETIRALSDVQEVIRGYESSEEKLDLKILREKQAVLTVSMHYDLLTYPVPSPATPKSPRILRALSNRLRFSHCKTTDGTDIE